MRQGGFSKTECIVVMLCLGVVAAIAWSVLEYHEGRHQRALFYVHFGIDIPKDGLSDAQREHFAPLVDASVREHCIMPSLAPPKTLQEAQGQMEFIAERERICTESREAAAFQGFAIP